MRLLFTGILVVFLFLTSVAERKISDKERGEIEVLLKKQIEAREIGFDI
jgi:hypothetical protein